MCPLLTQSGHYSAVQSLLSDQACQRLLRLTILGGDPPLPAELGWHPSDLPPSTFFDRQSIATHPAPDE